MEEDSLTLVGIIALVIALVISIAPVHELGHGGSGLSSA